MKFEQPLHPKAESNEREGCLNDEKIRPILGVNLELMMGSKKNQMIGILTRESMGGNAGEYEGFPCVVANFYYDKNTGEISGFTNYSIKGENLVEGSFRVIVDMSLKNPFLKIIEKHFSLESSKDAMENLTKSVDLYNQKNTSE